VSAHLFKGPGTAADLSGITPRLVNPILAGRRFLIVLATVLSVLGASCAAAHAQGAPGRVYFTQTAYTAHENQGELPITIARSDDSVGEDVRYGVRHVDAQPGLDLETIGNTLVHFEPGQSTATFNVKIIDRGMNAPPVGAIAYLFGSSPQSLGDATGKTYANGPINSPVTILRDDPLDTRNALDPVGYGSTLASPTASTTASHPLAESPFYVARALSPAGAAAARYSHSNPRWSRSLKFIASEAGAHRFYFWNTPADPAHTVARYLETVEARNPGTVQQLSTYSLVHEHCAADTSSAAFITRYKRWVQGLARGIGNFHVVMFLELDSLITTQCMAHNPQKIADRLTEIRDAVTILETNPHIAVYIDGGAADALSAGRTSTLLRRAGVQNAQGFFLNSTHFDWTTKEVAYGQKIAQKLGGKHFIVNTAENGQGPLVPKVRFRHGNEELCNPAGRGLGPLSTETGYTYVDAFLWFTNPGGSAGQGPGCGKGAPPTAVFWPKYAAGLATRANFRITGPKEHLLHDGPYVAYDAQTSPGARAPR
jgi:endoglucanase